MEEVVTGNAKLAIGNIGIGNACTLATLDEVRAASSVKTSLDMLLDKELLYRADDGYVVYDKLLAEYLRTM